jgi:hypothetical protein
MNIPKHILVIVPGFMGSKLKNQSSGELVWLNLYKLLNDPTRIGSGINKFLKELEYPNNDLVPDGIIDQMVFIPPLFKQEHYGRLTDTLEKLGYLKPGNHNSQESNYYYSFPYDWRQDNRISAKQLDTFIKKIHLQHENSQIWIIAHSNGGIVARWYIEKEGGKEWVNKLFLFGSPWDGAPKTLEILFNGPDIFLLNLFNQFDIKELTRECVLSFPSFYQLIPYYESFLVDHNDQIVNPFKETNWLKSKHHIELLKNAESFYTELGTNLSVETYCFFGIKNPTTTLGRIYSEPSGEWKKIKWIKNKPGDGTVPVHSAVHSQAIEKLPFTVAHGDIYANKSVLDKLEWELQGRYTEAMAPQTIEQIENLYVNFFVSSDHYIPNETMELTVTIIDQKTNENINKADLSVRIEWIQGIPSISELPPKDLPFVIFPSKSDTEGIFRSYLPAPEIAGYYRLVLMVETVQQRWFTIDETILVEPIMNNKR